MTVMRSRRIERGRVYVIAASNGYVKIGSTGGDPFERFGMVACHSPLPVTLAYICDCTHPVDVEEAVHRVLADHRAHREWFDVPPRMAVEAIRAVLAARGFMAVGVEGRRPSATGRPSVLKAELTESAVHA